MQRLKIFWAGLDAKSRTVIAAIAVLAIIVFVLNDNHVSVIWTWLSAG